MQVAVAVLCCSSQRKRSPTCPSCWAAVSLSLRSTRYPYYSYISSSLSMHLLILAFTSLHLLFPILTSSHPYAYILIVSILIYPPSYLCISSFLLLSPHPYVPHSNISSSDHPFSCFHSSICIFTFSLNHLSYQHLNAHT
jgi:hypothetical protein